MERMNGRVVGILKTVSGEDLGTDPREWWKWWQVHADVQLAAPKRVTIVQEQQSIGNAQPIYLSCFAAGTPVQTETGLIAIEAIRPGDRVLAQDVETGELAYKPVLHTTVRPERKLSRLQVGDETFTVTLGHRFWTPGRGWTKTVDLESQMRLRTATSSLPVISQKEGTTERTYNLVVADFHTYFVGNAAILTHDVEIPTRSDRVVPGLDRRRVAANRTTSRD